MLKSLSIRNVVLIDSLDLDFERGFNVLTGETGAGKSILLDAVGLILGRRAETGLIRTGCDKLMVSACFEFEKENNSLKNICEEYDMEFDNEIIIKRTLSRDGKGKIFFNDQPITQKLLKEIGLCLIEVHGQFDNQGLLNSATHRNVLDNYGNYGCELYALKEAFKYYKNIQRKRIDLENKIASVKQDEDNLRHWLSEFEMIKPVEGELEKLEINRQQMMNAEKIVENLDCAYKSLYQNLAVRDALRQAQSSISKVNAVTNDKYDNIFELLDTALINVDEASDEIESALREFSLGQDDINNIEERIFTLKDLARKHNVLVEDLPQTWVEIKDKLCNLETGEDNLSGLCKDEQQAKEKYLELADKVSSLRKSTALTFDAKIEAELPDLKMEKARFVTQIEKKDEIFWNENGVDDVCFLVSTNPNTPYGPISKIASGGELSRFMLALKVNLAQTSTVQTMIFDEVDAGIGGATAQAVGDKLAKLGKNVQVLVVTHSPQVAAKSECHFKVEKHTKNNITNTYLHQLSNEEKLEEVARMLAGEYITDEARAAARVLIEG